MSVAFLFPGQGAQNEGLLHYLPQHPEVTRTIAEARTLLRQDIGVRSTMPRRCTRPLRFRPRS
jgi:malonyl CoA-acyl carrier protein transacylase